MLTLSINLKSLLIFLNESSGISYIYQQSHSLTGLHSFESSNGVVSQQYCFQRNIVNCHLTRIILSAKMH